MASQQSKFEEIICFKGRIIHSHAHSGQETQTKISFCFAALPMLIKEDERLDRYPDGAVIMSYESWMLILE